MREKVKPRSRREIPAVNKVLDALGEYDASKLPRPLVVDLVRRGLSKMRRNSEIPEFESTVEQLHRSLEVFRASRLQPVINGTGIVIHTNFGRAPLTPEAVRALTEIGSGYSNLEYDLATGDRGHRGAYIENALALLCGAEAATVINNCAAALVLIVHHFAARNGRARPPGAPSKNEVIVSRGELVPTEQFNIAEHEPTPSDALKAGADLVCFSGDKLFGGPQAGIIAGKKRLVTALKREPLFRALRCDKLCFAALQATIDLHLNQAVTKIPAIGLLQVADDELRNRAAVIRNGLSDLQLQIEIGRSRAKVGGGTLPKSTMSSVTMEIVPRHCSPADLAARLRKSAPPLIGYIANDRFKLDLRTILPHQDDAVVDAIRAACNK